MIWLTKKVVTTNKQMQLFREPFRMPQQCVGAMPSTLTNLAGLATIDASGHRHWVSINPVCPIRCHGHGFQKPAFKRHKTNYLLNSLKWQAAKKGQTSWLTALPLWVQAGTKAIVVVTLSHCVRSFRPAFAMEVMQLPSVNSSSSWCLSRFASDWTFLTWWQQYLPSFIRVS